MSTILHIAPAEVVSPTRILVPIKIETDGVRINGTTIISESGDRVWAETSLGRETVVSHKLDPNEETNAYAVVAAEVSGILPLSIPMTTDDRDAVASVAHAIITNARPEW